MSTTLLTAPVEPPAKMAEVPTDVADNFSRAWLSVAVDHWLLAES
jgi:hypothetical protein